jgi:hypothetical protein
MTAIPVSNPNAFWGRSSRAGNNPERFRGCAKLPELFTARNKSHFCARTGHRNIRSSPKPDHNRVALATKHRSRCAEAGRSKSLPIDISSDRAARYRSDVLPVCADDNQPISTKLLRPARHEGDHRASTATNRCRLRVQITKYFVRTVWRAEENRHCVLGLDERTGGHWPILLNTTIRRKIRHRATR